LDCIVLPLFESSKGTGMQSKSIRELT
jgi:hypothetical protein